MGLSHAHASSNEHKNRSMLARPQSGFPIRRNSLPPLPVSQGRRSPCITHNVTEYCDVFAQKKLPSITSKMSTKMLPVHLSLDQALLSGAAGDEIHVTEPGLEEAEGITECESFVRSYDSQDSLKPVEVITLNNLNLCGVERQERCEKHKISENEQRAQAALPRPQQCTLTLTGSKAKCQERQLVGQSMSSRTVIVPKPSNQNKLLTRRPPKTNSMISMEERLARSAKANAQNKAKLNRSVSAKNSKKINKRAKTAGAKTRKNVCLLTCIKPSNLEEEKAKFMKSRYTYNPQFTYEFPASESVIARYNRSSTQYLPQAIAIMKRVLERYGNYEKFEWATGGQLLTKTQLWNTVKRYLEKEGFYGDVVVNISNDLIARAAMTINGGRPTLSIRESAAKKLWVEGLLRHEVGTHHLRFHNNRQQIWHNIKVRRQLGLKPANPTEEGLASLHSVLLRKDPSLWRSAILYYTIYKASQMSFCELFEDLGKYMDNPEVRWDYCLRSKRGQRDTSKPGCFCKDQVYLTGILQILAIRHTLDFHLLCTMGKVSHEDIEMLKPHYTHENTKIPGFMQDLPAYKSHLDHIVVVNGLEGWLEQEGESETKKEVPEATEEK